MKCSKCGTEFESNYCPECGRPAVNRCRRCGATLADGAVFCALCGARQNASNTDDKLKEQAIVGVVLGSISFFFGVVCCSIPFLSQVIAITTGIIGVVFSKKALKGTARDVAIWGLVLSIIGIVFGIAFIGLHIYAVINHDIFLDTYFDYFYSVM